MGAIDGSNDRIGGWQLMYQMLVRGQWLIADTCPLLIAAIPSRVHDPKRPGDLLKIGGDPLDDVMDSARYGLYSWVTAAEKPKETVLQEVLHPLMESHDYTSAMVRFRQHTAQNDSRQLELDAAVAAEQLRTLASFLNGGEPMDDDHPPGAPFANGKHLAKLREGVTSWNNWRSAHPDIIPELEGVVLQGTDLRVANFCRANLRKSDLSRTNLRSARFMMADLSFCNLTEAQLNGADLSGAQLSGAGLTFADLQEADLAEVNFDEARIGWTTFGYNDLSTAKNLASVLHSAPSVIGIDTIYRSHGNISQEFLRGAGVPDDFITYVKSLTGNPIEFYSCFISYSSKDAAFATELHTKLQGQHVRCWKDSEDLKIGDKFQEEIERAIRLHDKLLVVLSENSVNSRWVEREVQAAFEKEQRQGSIVLFPVRLDDAVMDCARAWAADIRRARHIGDFRKWKDHDSFHASFDRLLRDLKSEVLKG